MPARLLIDLWKNTKGATLVLAAFFMIAALGFTALVVDVGSLAVEKQRLQNAIDAAALAGAYNLPDTAKAKTTAENYIVKNGYKASDITVAFTDSNSVIHITGNKYVKYTFARVLGLDGSTVEPKCAADMKKTPACFDYAVFSGSTIDMLKLSGSGSYIRGSTHTNENFKASGSGLTITGACEATGTITITGSKVDVKTRITGAPVLDMPDFSENIRKQAEAAGQLFIGDKTFGGSSIDVNAPIYVEGNVTINGSGFRGAGCIIATGSITFNGSSQNVSSSDTICIYSKAGDVTFNGSGATIDGVVYAPNGNITFNGSGQTVTGRVIGDTVTFHGSDAQVLSGNDDLRSVPGMFVRLIQ